MRASQEFTDLFKAYSEDVQKIALATRALVLKLIPKAVEQVDAKSKVVGYGFGTGYKDMICSLMPAKTWVTLGIGWGAELPESATVAGGCGKSTSPCEGKEPVGVGQSCAGGSAQGRNRPLGNQASSKIKIMS